MNCLMPLSHSVFPLYLHEAIIMRPGKDPPQAEIWATVVAHVTDLPPQPGGAAANGRPTLHLLHAHRISHPVDKSDSLAEQDLWINRIINNIPQREIRPSSGHAAGMTVDIGTEGSSPETLWGTLQYPLENVAVTPLVGKPEKPPGSSCDTYVSSWPPEAEGESPFTDIVIEFPPPVENGDDEYRIFRFSFVSDAVILLGDEQGGQMLFPAYGPYVMMGQLGESIKKIQDSDRKTIFNNRYAQLRACFRPVQYDVSMIGNQLQYSFVVQDGIIYSDDSYTRQDIPGVNGVSSIFSFKPPALDFRISVLALQVGSPAHP